MRTFVFPGQGSQAKGMGGSLFDEFKELIRKVDKILGYSIKELCLEDPRNELNQTQFTQPALYVVNALSYFKRVEETGQKPNFAAGHSLGEFNALMVAECYTFEVGLKLVRKRGELMDQAVGGGMAAILNATKEKIETIIKEKGLTNIELANYNTPSQIVISGLSDEIERAQYFFQKREILYIPLKTSGAFHSKYMQPAKKKFETYLKRFKFSELKIPVISNFLAEPYLKNDIITNLSNQITGAVKWSESIQYLMGLGDMAFEEIGHGNVLTKLIQEIKEKTSKTPEKKVVLQENGMAQDVSLQKQELETPQQVPTEIKTGEYATPLTAEEKVDTWNRKYLIGSRVKSMVINDVDLKTHTEAMVLFGHKAAVYMKGYNGYFDLDEIVPL